MKLLADENVKGRLVKWLKAQGQDVAVAAKGAKNSRLWQLARTSRRALLTNDTDFLNTALYPPATASGVIVLRIFPLTLAAQQEGLRRLFAEVPEAVLAGKLVELAREGFELKTK